MPKSRSIRWGLLGAGAISRRFAKGLELSVTGYLVAVASRTREAAHDLSFDAGCRAYHDYDELLADPEVSVVYIGLPHHMHAEWTAKAAKAGKHVLCEKPFTMTAREAEAALDEVSGNDVFCMEAFMYRCHPQTQELKRLLDSGEIGQVHRIRAEFGFNAPREWQNFRTRAELGGGGLMDVGCYCVSMSRMIAGCEPSEAEYRAELTEGYDSFGEGTLIFPNGIQAEFACGIHTDALKNTVTIWGSEGRIEVPSPWFCDQPLLLFKGESATPLEISKGGGVDLFGNEADVVQQHLHDREAPHVSWRDTLGNMRTLDRLRESAGMSFQQ